MKMTIARMNLYLNSVEDFSIVREDTLGHPAFINGSRLRTFDIVLANPPYAIKQWNREAFMKKSKNKGILYSCFFIRVRSAERSAA